MGNERTTAVAGSLTQPIAPKSNLGRSIAHAGRPMERQTDRRQSPRGKRKQRAPSRTFSCCSPSAWFDPRLRRSPKGPGTLRGLKHTLCRTKKNTANKLIRRCIDYDIFLSCIRPASLPSPRGGSLRSYRSHPIPALPIGRWLAVNVRVGMLPCVSACVRRAYRCCAMLHGHASCHGYTSAPPLNNIPQDC